MKHDISLLKGLYSKKLPSNQLYFTKSDLIQAGFPPFLAERSEQIALANLSADISFPHSKWVSTDAVTLREKWSAFIASVESHVHIPSEEMPDVLDQSLDDILNILSNPRGFLPDFIYRDEDKLSASELLKRCSTIVVYRHFAVFTDKYIIKKKIEVLSKQQFASVINSVDERLSSSYGTLEWASMSSSAFLLYNGSVPSDFFAYLFRHKEMPVTALKFSRLDTTLNPDSFIEAYSQPDPEILEDVVPEPVIIPEPEAEITEEETITPETIDAEQFPEDETSDLPEEILADEIPDDETPDEKILPDDDGFPEEINVIHQPDEQQEDGIDDEELMEDDSSLNDAFIKPEEKDEPDKAPESDDIPLYKMHLADDDDVNDDNDVDSDVNDVESRCIATEPVNNENVQPVSDDINVSEDDEDDEEPIYAMFGKHKNDRIKEREEAEDKNEEQVPMWKTFSREDEDVIPFSSDAVDDAKKPFMRIKMFEPPVPENAGQQLMEHLSGSRAAYIAELFDGDEPAYEYSIEQLANFRNWREAGKYLTHDIFKRNTIDMYSDTAVDFTDKLHKFFIDRDRQR